MRIVQRKVTNEPQIAYILAGSVWSLRKPSYLSCLALGCPYLRSLKGFRKDNLLFASYQFWSACLLTSYMANVDVR